MATLKVAYFTAGTVGAGHLVRGVAVGRALHRRGFAGRYRMFGPPLPYPAAARPDYRPVEVRDDPALLDPAAAPASRLAEELRRFGPDLLLVDMFWAPVRHILPTLDCEAWLLLRACPDQWLHGTPRLRYDPTLYGRVIGIEPAAPAEAERVEPIVVANPDECRSPGELRARFAVASARRLTVVVHAGLADERPELVAAAAGEGEVVVLSLFEPGAPFPAAEWLGGADHVISGAGFNAFWEAHWLGYRGRTTFVPLPRRIDDQARRLTTCRDHPMAVNGADRLAGWIVGRGV